MVLLNGHELGQQREDLEARLHVGLAIDQQQNLTEERLANFCDQIWKKT